MQKYKLMHKNVPCAAVSFDDISGTVTGYRTINPAYTPFLEHCDVSKFKKWWEMRAVPASRELMKRVIRDAGVLTPESYLVKNLALSMTDTYWICPEGASLKYEDVSFTNFKNYGRSKIPYHNATSYDPNASLGGSMDKYWDLSGDIPVLVKESYKYYGQQAVNEVFATWIHELQGTNIPFVRYSASRTSDGGIISKCPAFTSGKEEFIPAYDVLESRPVPNDINYYNAYIDIAAGGGIDADVMQEFMDYQTLTDFVISNTDEHLLNFGLLRDPDTMQLTGPAPIFDSGNSMFYSEERITPYSRVELLARKITGFYQREERMLRNVQNPFIVRTDLLPSSGQAKDFYAGAGIPEAKAEFISKNFETKVRMLDEIQHGKKISLYQEVKAEKEHKNAVTSVYKADGNVQQFILIAGIPGSGKEGLSKEILKGLEKEGYHPEGAAALYPAGKADEDSAWIVDIPKVARTLRQQESKKYSVAVISMKEILCERIQNGLSDNMDLVRLTAFARIRQALLNGMSVIYSAPNLEKEEREDVLKLAQDKPEVYRRMVVLYQDPEQADSEIRAERLKRMAEKLHNSHPSKSEGWDNVVFLGMDVPMNCSYWCR